MCPEEQCTHDCGSCDESCESRIEKVKPNPKSSIKKVIGVISGKGGVGKSLVSSLLATSLNTGGVRVGILDADITGPSIPRAFGINEKAMSDGELILPAQSREGISIVSAAMLLENDSDPIIWRGPLVSNLVKQFFTDVLWEDIDFLVIDMPPGTGDIALTIFQSLPIDAIIIVTSPQELVGVIVKKAIEMANMMNIKILGIVENMAYVECPHCNERIDIYGKGHTADIAKQYGLKVLAEIPIRADISTAADEGKIETIENHYLDKAVKLIKSI